MINHKMKKMYGMKLSEKCASDRCNISWMTTYIRDIQIRNMCFNFSYQHCIPKMFDVAFIKCVNSTKIQDKTGKCNTRNSFKFGLHSEHVGFR